MSIVIDGNAPTWAHDLARKVSAEMDREFLRLRQANAETAANLAAGSVPVSNVADLPAATAGLVRFVPDETGGAVLAFADGTNFRRVTDRTIVS